jgi:phage tail sheath protein FI
LYLGGGSDGSAVTDTHMTAALDLLTNPDDIFFTLLMDGGWATAAMGLAMDSVCSARQDSVAISSTPLAAEANASYVNELLEYRKEVLNLNSSYSALYTPHVKIQDKFNDRVLFIAPDGYAAAAISASASNFEIWFPPAGNKRGVVNVLDVRRRFSSGELDVLSDAQINCLKFTPGKGIRIWGQSTLKSSPSKLQELNVRLLLISVEPAVKAALEDFLFDLNDASTRSLAQGVVNAFMEDIQARRGVSAYRVVCDTSNNTNQDISSGRMVLDLFMIPTGAVKEITARVIITNEGVDFSTLAV